VLLGGIRYIIQGSFDENGHFQQIYTTKLRAPLNTFTLVVDQDLVFGNLVGTLTTNGNVAQLDGRKIPVYTKLSPPSTLGKYTIGLMPEAVAPTSKPPQGAGYGILNVGVTGIGKLVGKLPDGTPFTAAAPLNSDDMLAYNVALYSKKGWINGYVAPAALPNLSTGAAYTPTGAPLLWVKPASPVSVLTGKWLQGFETNLDVVGSKLIAPKGYKPSITTIQKDVPVTVIQRASIFQGTGGTVTVTGAVSPAGTFKGVWNDAGVKTPFKGVYLQNAGDEFFIGFGLFKVSTTVTDSGLFSAN